MYVSLVRSLLILLLSSVCEAAEIPTLNSSVRALGMGEAYTALVNNGDALFYNPAGLAKVVGINWRILSLRAGTDREDAYTLVEDLQGGNEDDLADLIDELYGEQVWFGVGASSIFTAPMFGFGIYSHTDALIRADNPVSTQLYTSIINDYGYVLGFGIPIAPVFHAGFNLRYVKRTGDRLPWGAGSLADLDTSLIESRVLGWGRGYGADFGANLILPLPLFTATIAATWRNIGRTTFRSGDPNSTIPADENDITVGAALLFNTPVVGVAPTVDFRYLNRSDIQLTRKINLGIEIDLPLIDIRGGFREGYWTAGLGLSLGLFQIDLATYGAELGEYPGQIEDRRYVAEFTMELGVGSFTAPNVDPKTVGASGGSTGRSGTGSAGDGSSSSRSSWGGGLKQRR